MKTNILHALALALVATLAIMSCSKSALPIAENEVENSDAVLFQRLPVAQLTDLQAEYKDILLSGEYATYRSHVQAMMASLKLLRDAPLSSRAVFQAWVTANLSATTFQALVQR